MVPSFKGSLTAQVADIPNKASIAKTINSVHSQQLKQHIKKAKVKSFRGCKTLQKSSDPQKLFADLDRTGECWNESKIDIIQDAAFNRRDQVFTNEIGKALCDASKWGIPSINVSVGAGHQENLSTGLKKALKNVHLDDRILVRSQSLETWYSNHGFTPRMKKKSSLPASSPTSK